ncbi:uncharacterized protein B0P05DRAFT_550159 [Gilbertella persicaria]|uniref:uncharacterized protein n=1 Tax=Gilbertella persicaria TaxID=101096 RepID=UPI00222056BE|nr:uncharacterized protein B0P05DRAFT_550159 [Gilbertella persicaria]KAI8070553.1 hypothetical protein B0P05DRAFT_550159 [Gilbertella persicaria]
MPLFSKKIVPTDITSNIEKATNPSVTELDWALVFQICDAVNSTDLGAKEARKLLQKKMMSNESKTQVLALEILNSLAENCTAKFQPQLAAKSFGEDLVSLASNKTVDDRVSGKLAQCLESWVGQVGGDPQFGAIRRAYDVMTQGSVLPNKRQQVARNQPSTVPRQPADVKNDIEVAKNSAQLFFQTLSFTDPTKQDISQNELIQEFYAKCKKAQHILGSHLETCNDSEMISALINANNELLSCFKTYDEMLEQHAVNEATIHSQTLHNRSTRHEEPFSSSSSSSPPAAAAAASASIATATTHHSHNPFKLVNDDPFDPFADTNQAPSTAISNNDTTVNNAGAVLPPPLTPQKMHD